MARAEPHQILLTPFEQTIIEEVRENDPEKCSHGKYLWCEECNTRSYESGQDTGFEAAGRVTAKVLGDVASALFLQGKDEQARAVRDLLSKAEEAFKDYKKKR